MEPDQFGGLSRFSGFSGVSGFRAEGWGGGGGGRATPHSPPPWPPGWSPEIGTAYSDKSSCSAVATGRGSKTCGVLEMGTAYSDIWACSAALIGGCPTAEATLVSCLRAAAQAILRCSASSCSIFLYLREHPFRDAYTQTTTVNTQTTRIPSVPSLSPAPGTPGNACEHR